MNRPRWKFIGFLALICTVVLILPLIAYGADNTTPYPEYTYTPGGGGVADSRVVEMLADVALPPIGADGLIEPWYPEGPGGGGVIWDYYPSPESSGTGVFNTYLAVQDKGIERGLNTGLKVDKGLYDEDDSKTMALELANVPIVEIDGVWYREFAADINQSKKGYPEQLISLEVIQIWQTDHLNVYDADYTFSMDTSFEFSPGDTNLVYDLDIHNTGSQNLTLIMDYGVNTGSGKPDYKVYIPHDWFLDKTYVIMVVHHGKYVSANAGFEEWGVRGFNTVTGTKFHDLDADGEPQETGEPGLENWTIYIDIDDDGVFTPFVDADSDGEWDAGEGDPYTYTDADGNYILFGSVIDGLSGTYNVREVQEIDWVQSFPREVDYPGMVYPIDFSDGGLHENIDFGNYLPSASKSGYKWHDLDADGVWDEGELPIENWVIFIDESPYNGILDSGEVSVMTDADGFKSVAYAKLVAPLIEATKEQQKLIKSLQSENALINKKNRDTHFSIFIRGNNTRL